MAWDLTSPSSPSWVLGPSVIFIISAVWRCIRLRREPIKVIPNYRGLWKVLLAFVFAGLHLRVLISVIAAHNPIAIAASAVAFTASLFVPLLSFIEHGRSVSPSATLNIYLLVALALGLIRLAWIHVVLHDVSSPWNVAIPAVAFALLILEAHDKRSLLREPWQNVSLEETTSVLSKAFLWWILPLLRKGNQQILILDDLFSMHSELSSQSLRDRMLRFWGKRSTPEGRYSLLAATIKCTFWQNAKVLPSLSLLLIFQYAQPLFISRMIAFVTAPLSSEEQRAEAIKLVIAVIGIFVGQAICNALTEIAMTKASLAVKGSVIGIIHDRALTVGNNAQGSAVTLIGNDVLDIAQSAQSFYQVLLAALQLVVGVYLLASKLGWTCLVPFALVFVSSKGSKHVAANVGPSQNSWSLATEARVSLMTAILEKMKIIKMMGLSEHMAAKINTARGSEMKSNIRLNSMITLLTFVSGMVKNLAPVLTLVIFAIQAKLRGQDGLDTNTAFTSIAIITYVTQPINTVLLQIPFLLSALTGFDRVQNYLLNPSHQDRRLLIEAQVPKSDGDREESRVQNRSLAIEIQEATIRPAPDAEPVLEGLNVSIHQGSLVFCAGAVGTGKTTLAKAILGEISPDRGTVSVSSASIGYCAQSAWLMNGTIQQLICGPPGSGDVDQQWYQRVVYACDLKNDIQRMPQGDQTVIGSGGIILSGGQRQRVALARAVYSKLNIMVLDDVLSALDAQTETHIVDRLLGENGLLRSIGVTVFLITHTTQHFPLADYILVLGEDRRVSEQGTWEQLRAQSGYISKLLLHEPDRSQQKIADENDNSEVKSSAPERPERSMDLVRQKGDPSLYSYYFDSMGKLNAVIMMSGMAAMALFSMATQYWLKWWTDADGHDQWFYMTVYILLAMATWVTNIGWVYMFLVVLAPKSSIVLHQRLLRTVISAPLSFFTTTDMGTTLTRFSQDLKQVDRMLPGAVAGTGLNGFRLIGQLLLLVVAQRYMGLTFPFLLLALYGIQTFYLHTTRQLRWLDMESASLVSNNFLDTIEGLTTIRAFGWEHAFATDNSRSVDTSQKPEYNLQYLQAWLHLAMDLTIAGLALSLVLFTIPYREYFSGGEIGIALNVLLTASITLLVTLESWTRLEASLGVISRIRSFEQGVAPESKPGEDQQPPTAWPDKGTVQITEIVASYSSESTALNQISLDIAPGEKIGICGRTGSGKSSLLLSVLRLIELSSGTITIDDLDLQMLPREAIRSRIITIPQDPLLMKFDTLRENLDPTGTISDEKIIATLEKVKLWSIFTSRTSSTESDEPTPSLENPDKPETCLDALLKDYPLSVGQQQLFSLARAMLMRSTRGKLVILDEATSNIDKETDGLIQELLRVEFQGYSVLTVAHRLDTILDSDKIVVLDQGKIVEVGPPQELLQKDQGAFKGLLGK
ncbi:putative multidrug resistance protein [Aspergillus ibericus CBS 121593]|uniref:Putative multidrug resistance protein n=1 Tax=Aspergillus ibericus CBS 121593 TaxID=1448316 RepID=A0A395H0N0_9EURO|nr:putative multidrug resistance protein [Aspergillus ibericus CBS 121593]RAL01356.1 putative multidrug resistance protein [Aspergillus ibericus CBS 121593]